jgi:PilZ domain-containing protein
MPELIRSIASRLREFIGNRRRAPRYVTHLEAGLALSVSLSNAKGSAVSEGQPLKLAGYTRDISATGLALIVPAIRIGGQYITGENRTLEIMLKLPTATIKIRATPVRYSPLEQEGTDTGYLIGAQIVHMSDQDRTHFDAYLETLTTG